MRGPLQTKTGLLGHNESTRVHHKIVNRGTQLTEELAQIKR